MADCSKYFHSLSVKNLKLENPITGDGKPGFDVDSRNNATFGEDLVPPPLFTDSVMVGYNVDSTNHYGFDEAGQATVFGRDIFLHLAFRDHVGVGHNIDVPYDSVVVGYNIETTTPDAFEDIAFGRDIQIDDRTIAFGRSIGGGRNSIMFGQFLGQAGITGSDCVFIGDSINTSSVLGSLNTVVGKNSMRQNNIVGDRNSVFGYNNFQSLGIVGDSNTVFGYNNFQSLCTVGDSNTVIGSDNYILLGVIGSNNHILGNNNTGNGFDGTIMIGNSGVATADNQLTISLGVNSLQTTLSTSGVALPPPVTTLLPVTVNGVSYNLALYS